MFTLLGCRVNKQSNYICNGVIYSDFKSLFKVAGLANILGNIKLNVDLTNSHSALKSFFTNPSFKKAELEMLTMFP